jgi:malonyl-CoA O-methyltransferase
MKITQQVAAVAVQEVRKAREIAHDSESRVMDMEMITLSYPQLDALFEELEATGTSMLVRGWDRWKGAGAALKESYASKLRNGKYPLSFEIIYGAAFGPQEGQPVKTPDGDVATFSVDSLRRSRQGKSSN